MTAELRSLLRCAREGAHVIYHRDRPGAEAVAVEIADLGRHALVVPTDIGSVKQIERMFPRPRKTFPRPELSR